MQYDIDYHFKVSCTKMANLIILIPHFSFHQENLTYSRAKFGAKEKSHQQISQPVTTVYLLANPLQSLQHLIFKDLNQIRARTMGQCCQRRRPRFLRYALQKRTQYTTIKYVPKSISCKEATQFQWYHV